MRQFQAPHFNTNGQKNIRYEIGQFMWTKEADPGTHFQSLFRANLGRIFKLKSKEFAHLLNIVLAILTTLPTEKVG